MTMSLNKEEFGIKIVEISDEDDGSATVSMEIDDSFMSWFCRHYQIEEFSKEKFNEWFLAVLNDYVNKHR
jgi:hypothetical protein